METIVCAAIKRSDGIILAGRNHAFLINNSPKDTCKKNSQQGFLTSEGRFVSRSEAGDIAFKAGQTKDDSLLFSEDITKDNPWAGEVITSLRDKLKAKDKRIAELKDFESYSYYVGGELTCNRKPTKYGPWWSSFKNKS